MVLFDNRHVSSTRNSIVDYQMVNITGPLCGYDCQTRLKLADKRLIVTLSVTPH
jgi:hypothetical protein